MVSSINLILNCIAELTLQESSLLSLLALCLDELGLVVGEVKENLCLFVGLKIRGKNTVTHCGEMIPFSCILAMKMWMTFLYNFV